MYGQGFCPALLPRLKTGLAAAASLLALGALGQPTDLIISEYVEGSGSNNKYLELFNGTVANIDLSDYELHLFVNGSPTSSYTLALSGTLNAGNTIVYGHTGGAYSGTYVTDNSLCNFNGDDAIGLWKVSTLSFVDIFGNIGCDPGAQWSGLTQDRTLVRNANVCAGVTMEPGNPPCSFPTVTTEWSAYPMDDVASLGSHTMDCVKYVEFDPGSIYRSELESTGTTTFTLNFSSSVHSAGTVYLSIEAGGTALYGPDYSTTPALTTDSIVVPFAANVASVSFTANIVSDALVEPAEYTYFLIDSVSTGSNIGPGTEARGMLVISDASTVPAVFAPGELLVVGFNSDEVACSGISGEDVLSFFALKDITPGTAIIITDNGYEQCNAGSWGNKEGTMLMVRTGPSIPAGQVVTFRLFNALAPGNIVPYAPDNGWSSTDIGQPPGAPFGSRVAFPTGEQVFLLQGTWNPGTYSGSYQNDASFTGTILFGFNSKTTWTASCSSNSDSNLPAQAECFSTTMTTTGNWCKYIGPTSTASPRDWVLRVSLTSNWPLLTDCFDYQSSGMDWLSAPVLPISASPITAGLWRGDTDADWFQCRNWDDLTVPNSTTNVSLNENSSGPCTVGLSTGLNPGGTAVCAQVDLTSSTAVSPELSIADNSSLQVGGPFTILRTAGTGALVASLQDGARLQATDLWLQSVNGTLSEAVLQIDQDDSQARFSGDLTLEGGGLLDMNGGTSDSLFLGGHFNNNVDETRFDDVGSVVVFNGSGDQSVAGLATEEYFDTLWVNKPSGIVMIEMPIRLRNVLKFGQGLVVDTLPGALVTFEPDAIAETVSDASHVVGPVRKFGGNDFYYPVGGEDFYRPCALLDNTATDAEAFTARYYPENPDVAPTLLTQITPLDHISHCEYWTIDQSDGSPHARVRLTWDTPASCQTTPFDITDLRVVRWNGSNWIDHGNLNATGTSVSGEVSGAAVETAFSPWTLGSLTSNNPLPVELLGFTAVPNGTAVDVAWQTASEHNSAWFTVERSVDAVHFQPVVQLPAAGNSQYVLHYAAVDANPLEGLSYYRLRQKDLDGSSALSALVPVVFRGDGDGLSVLYAPTGPLLAHALPVGTPLVLLDPAGRHVASWTVDRTGALPLPMEGLAHGAYLLRAMGPAPLAVRFAW